MLSPWGVGMVGGGMAADLSIYLRSEALPCAKNYLAVKNKWVEKARKGHKLFIYLSLNQSIKQSFCQSVKQSIGQLMEP